MNVLYLCHRIPYPPDKGDKVRSYRQVQHLAARHELHLACLYDDPRDAPHIETLRRSCASVEIVFRGKLATRAHALAALPTETPLSVSAFYSRALARRVEERIRTHPPDAVVVFSSAMARYVPPGTAAPVIVDFVDVDSDKWRMYAELHPGASGWIYGLEARRLARFESRVARRAEISLFVSDAEAELFRSRGNDGRIEVIPNGVDIDYFHPGEEGKERSADDPPTLVFVGMMDYFPNVDAVETFCREIFPRVRGEMPRTRFLIVGRNPTAAVRKLERLENVVVTGAVPDVRPYLRGAVLMVAPFRVARGVQNKVLESMATRVPVVGTPLAFQGLRATEDDGVRIRETAEGQAAAILELLRDPEQRRRAAEAARRYVERAHRWPDHGARLESLVLEVAEPARARARKAGA